MEMQACYSKMVNSSSLVYSQNVSNNIMYIGFARNYTFNFYYVSVDSLVIGFCRMIYADMTVTSELQLRFF
jgi:hypothetical protein